MLALLVLLIEKMKKKMVISLISVYWIGRNKVNCVSEGGDSCFITHDSTKHCRERRGHWEETEAHEKETKLNVSAIKEKRFIYLAILLLVFLVSEYWPWAKCSSIMWHNCCMWPNFKSFFEKGRQKSPHRKIIDHKGGFCSPPMFYSIVILKTCMFYEDFQHLVNTVLWIFTPNSTGLLWLQFQSSYIALCWKNDMVL